MTKRRIPKPEAAFFERGRQVARAADRGEPLPVLAETESLPVPPAGYPSWLDYAVSTMNTRSVFLDLCITDSKHVPSRESMERAVRHELQELRRKAGES